MAATGLCRSDWHGWMGHDDGITLPHVPGHELAGEIVAVDAAVRDWRVGASSSMETIGWICIALLPVSALLAAVFTPDRSVTQVAPRSKGSNDLRIAGRCLLRIGPY